MNNKDELSKIIEKFSLDRTFTRQQDRYCNYKLDDYIYPQKVVWHKNQEKPPLIDYTARDGLWQHPVPYWYAYRNTYIYIKYEEEIRVIPNFERNKERDEAIYNLACILYQQNTETE